MSLLITLIAFLVALGMLIVFHELGHYSVARLCGVKVLRFSVGFGAPLWRRRFGPDQTEWVIAAFPLGGYVKMLDEREGEVAPQERASCVQPPVGATALRHRRGGPDRQLPAGHRRVLGAVHARGAGRQAGARSALPDTPAAAGRRRLPARPSCASATSR